MSIDKQVKLICRDNQYLLNECEVKEIIECWKQDRNALVRINVILNTILKKEK
jgi:hypothetical protein